MTQGQEDGWLASSSQIGATIAVAVLLTGLPSGVRAFSRKSESTSAGIGSAGLRAQAMMTAAEASLYHATRGPS